MNLIPWIRDMYSCRYHIWQLTSLTRSRVRLVSLELMLNQHNGVNRSVSLPYIAIDSTWHPIYATGYTGPIDGVPYTRVPPYELINENRVKQGLPPL